MQEKQDKSQEGAIAALRKALKEAQAVVIGAGAGLSISAGFSMSGPRFYEHFRISRMRMDFKICIPADFTHLIRWRNTGPIGAGILS